MDVFSCEERDFDILFNANLTYLAQAPEWPKLSKVFLLSCYEDSGPCSQRMRMMLSGRFARVLYISSLSKYLFRLIMSVVDIYGSHYLPAL